MTDLSPNEAMPDPELGPAIRAALAMPHDGAFVTRVRALVRQQRERGWDEVLAGWFWQGVLAASLAVVAVAAAWRVTGGVGATPRTGEESVAVQLLDGDRPGADILLASMAGDR
ncbi:MAG: hypothetical protein KC544_05085 [Gemmatimonadetes bacterium]|nr:hypothetical protein [Gemmatimonadota bacterium]MCB9518488.1 hypothetical protein [Gemmatimonadales bacterium]MCA9762488.1 hypothetical protein [Gemmatimonadota bacterium]MCA9768738.1 hypothetical protein [Gemmatimonadota bacterium]HPF61378.1 hypothetical protein [Gemmatimonadales bacterium]